MLTLEFIFGASIFELIFRPEVLVFLIPLSAIVGGMYLSYMKTKAKIQSNSFGKEDRLLLRKTLEENRVIKERLSNLETIVTDLDQGLLQSFPKKEKEELPEKTDKPSENTRL